MCDHGCSEAVDCAHVREGDTWLSSTLRPRPATETHNQPKPVPEVTPTVSALAATLRRDGGADHYERGQTGA